MQLEFMKTLKVWCLMFAIAAAASLQTLRAAECVSCGTEQDLRFNLRGIGLMAGSATVKVSYASTEFTVVMSGGSVVFNPNTQRYEAESYQCVQWPNDITIEPKCDQPVKIEFFLQQDDQDPAYTEFKFVDGELNPIVFWTRPSSKCLKVYMDRNDDDWIYEPLVFVSAGTDPTRMKGVLEFDDSNAGDSRGPAAGLERPEPDVSELTNAPPVGDVSADCPGQGGGFAAGEFIKSAQSLQKTKVGKRDTTRGLSPRTPQFRFDDRKVDAVEINAPQGGTKVPSAKVPSPALAKTGLNGYSAATPIGQLHWDMSLGSVRRTLRLGSLGYQTQVIDSNAYSPERLTLASGGDPKTVINSGGALRQIELPETLIDIVLLTNTGVTNGFQIGVYSKAQVGPFNPGTGLFPTNGLPLLTWKVENPDAAPLGRIRFTKTEGTNSEIHLAEWQGTNQVAGTMSITRHNGKWRDVTEYFMAVTNRRVETVSLYKGTNLQHKARQVFQEFYNWGAPGDVFDAVVERVEDPDGQALTSTFTYWDQTSQPGNLLFLATHPDGYSERVPNRLSGSGYVPVAASGTPVRVDRPYRDFPAGHSSARSTFTTFDLISGQEILEEVETVVGGQLVGFKQTLHDFTTPGYWITVTAEYADETQYAYEEQAMSLSTRRVAYSRDRQGRTQNFLYTPGYWDPDTESFSQSPSGNAVLATKVTAVNGTVDAPEGIANVTTVDVRVEDHLGHVRSEEAYVSTGNWEATTALIDRSVHAYNDGRRTATRRNGRLIYQASYRADGKVEWEKNEAGRRTDYIYDEMNRVHQKIVEGRGGDANRITTFDYNVFGNVISEVVTADGISLQATSTYNLAGQLVAAVGADGLTNRIETSYTSGAKVVTETRPTSATRITSYFKDRQPRTQTGTAVEDEYYAPFMAVWAPGSYREAFSVYRDGALTQLKRTEIVNWLGQEILFRTPEFQGMGNRDRYTQYDVDGEGLSRQLVNSIAESGRATQLFSYNSLGRLIARGLDLNTNGILDAASTDVLTTVDERFTNSSGTWEGVTTIQRYLQDNIGTPTLMQRTRIVVPAHLPANVLASNIVERAGGGLFFSAATINTNSGEITTIENNQELGQVGQRIERDGLLRAEMQPGINTPRSYAYTGLGEILVVNDPVVGSATNTYDAISRRLLSVTDHAGRQTVYDYYPAGGLGAGQVKGVRDAATNWTFFEYNLQGQLYRKWGVNTYPVEHQFDDAGRMTLMKTFRSLPGSVAWASSTWPNPPGGDVTQWVYDSQSGLLAQKIYADAGAGAKTTGYTYGPGGFLDAKTNGRGQVSDYTIDGAGRLTAVTYSDGTLPTTLTYDRAGRLRSIRDSSGTKTLTWNERDQLLSEVYTNSLLTGIAVSRTYDSQFRLEQLELVRSGVTQTRQRFAYDALSWLDYIANESPDDASQLHKFDYTYRTNSPFLESIAFSHGLSLVMTQSYSRDALGRLALASASLANGESVSSVSYQFNELNRRLVANLGDGTRWDYAYNNRGEIIAGKKKLPSGIFAGGQQFEYVYDDIGNRTAARSGGNANGANLREALSSGNTLNQVTTRQTPGSSWIVGDAPTNLTLIGAVDGHPVPIERQEDGHFFAEATFDNATAPVFSRVTILGKEGTNVVDLKSGYQYIARNPEVFVYDADGNLVADGRWTNTWDCENRLIASESLTIVPENARKRLEFKYDHQGRRIEKTVYEWVGSQYIAQSTNRYVYDGWNLLAVLDSGSSIIQSFRWGLDMSGTLHEGGGIGGLLAVHAAGNEVHFPSFDGRGNVVALVSATNGMLTARYEYGPFGELITLSGVAAIHNPFRFSTKFYDEETKLVYFGYRYLNTFTGRWMSRDALQESGGLNLYAAMNNNPIDFTDPLGLFSLEGFGNGLLGIVTEPFKMGSDLLVVGMIACNNALSDNQIYAEDTDFLSGIGKRQVGRVIEGQGALEASLKGGGEVLGNVFTGGALGVGQNIYENVDAYNKGLITLEQLDYNLSLGAGGQVGGTMLGSGVSKYSGYGWTGRGAANPALEQTLVNTLIEARQNAGKSGVGDATFAVVGTADGMIGPVAESLASPNLAQLFTRSSHAEPQVLGFGGKGTKYLAVDQNPCNACQIRIIFATLKSPVRVVGPGNPNNPLTGPKTSAVNGASGKYSPSVQNLGNYGYTPLIVFPVPSTGQNSGQGQGQR